MNATENVTDIPGPTLGRSRACRSVAVLLWVLVISAVAAGTGPASISAAPVQLPDAGLSSIHTLDIYNDHGRIHALLSGVVADGGEIVLRHFSPPRMQRCRLLHQSRIG